jgi:outer membrane protein OmpA-like peptidoglycan-associated protein
MSKKVVFPLIAVVAFGLSAGSLGCKAEAKFNAGGEAKPAPPPPPPEPAKPEPPKEEPKPEPKALKAIGKAKIENNEIKIPGKIKFDFDKATIKEDAETKEILNTLVSVMKENPSITKLRVEGHTDDKGGSDHNHKLSQARADAVAEWLSKNGVDKGRLDTKGWGEEHPVEKNDNDAHRENNRRVEFKVWELDGKQTEVATKEASSGKPETAATPATPATPGKKDDKAGATTTTAGKSGTTPATPATPAKK